MLSDGNGLYLRKDANGNFVPVKNIALGDVWEDRQKAHNVLINCVSRNLRDRYKLIEIEKNEQIQPQKQTNKSVGIANVDVRAKDIIAKKIGEDHFDDMDLYGLIEKFATITQNTEDRRSILYAAISEVDKEITDINHYIELGKFNCYQGWLAFNMLRTKLKKRRRIKNELYILTQLGECKVNSSMIADIKEAIGGLDKQKYHPRILTELFD